MKRLNWCFVLLFIAVHLHLAFSKDYEPGKANFLLKFKSESSPYRIMGVFVLPGETLHLEIAETKIDGIFNIKHTTGKLILVKKNKWRWESPAEPGLYPMTILNPQASDSMLLNIFVMVPYEKMKGKYLNGYRIGTYPKIPLKQLSIYKIPHGFIEATKENEDTFIAPHFKLKEFLSKQGCGYPKYLVLKERLLLKLELILEKVNEKGYCCDSFHIMSGYRTPYYNKAIGNVKYSRHVWGGAADIFIDENPEDGMMDDLNNDGKIDYHDAKILYDIIDDLYGKPWYTPFVGGLGRYKKTASHGPFVHVDVREFRARWGD